MKYIVEIIDCNILQYQIQILEFNLIEKINISSSGKITRTKKRIAKPFLTFETVFNELQDAEKFTKTKFFNNLIKTLNENPRT